MLISHPNDRRFLQSTLNDPLFSTYVKNLIKKQLSFSHASWAFWQIIMSSWLFFSKQILRCFVEGSFTVSLFMDSHLCSSHRTHHNLYWRSWHSQPILLWNLVEQWWGYWWLPPHWQQVSPRCNAVYPRALHLPWLPSAQTCSVRHRIPAKKEKKYYHIIMYHHELIKIYLSRYQKLGKRLGTVHKHLLGGWYKKGVLKIFDLCMGGGLEKNYHKFSSIDWVYMLFYGVDPQFSCYLRFEGRGVKNVHNIFFCIRPPRIFFVNGPLMSAKDQFPSSVD